MTVTTSGFDTLKVFMDVRESLSLRNRTVHALVGPTCQSGILACAPTNGLYDIPMVSYISIAYQALQDRNTTYRTLSRVGIYSAQQGTCIGCVLLRSSRLYSHGAQLHPAAVRLAEVRHHHRHRLQHQSRLQRGHRRVRAQREDR